MSRWLSILTSHFPTWVTLCSVMALVHPPWFTWFKGEASVVGLAVIMLGMGMTLQFADFQKVFKIPRAIGLGLLSQFTIMPLLGWSLANGFRLDSELAVGLILVSCCPGGTASNVVAYLARANVALSVLMTMSSTFASILLTPLLTKWLAGAWVEVDAWGLFKSTVQVVLLPVVAGLVANQYAGKWVRRVLPVFPLISVIFITLIVASIIGQNSELIKQSAGKLITAVFMLHAGGFYLGHALAGAFRYDHLIRRTISIETGMQNSGLGVVLAQRHFPGTAATVPCAISSVFHCLIGSFMAAVWSRNPDSRPKQSS